jgi:hypothetical protein
MLQHHIKPRSHCRMTNGSLTGVGQDQVHLLCLPVLLAEQRLGPAMFSPSA